MDQQTIARAGRPSTGTAPIALAAALALLPATTVAVVLQAPSALVLAAPAMLFAAPAAVLLERGWRAARPLAIAATLAGVAAGLAGALVPGTSRPMTALLVLAGGASVTAGLVLGAVTWLPRLRRGTRVAVALGVGVAIVLATPIRTGDRCRSVADHTRCQRVADPVPENLLVAGAAALGVGFALSSPRGTSRPGPRPSA